jgi:hypothetical protein
MAIRPFFTRAGHDAITREFRVNNDAAGDLVIYFD